MEAFISHAIAAQVLCRNACSSRRKQTTSSSHMRNEASVAEAGFLGQSFRPRSIVMYPHRGLVSCPFQRLDEVKLRASAKNTDGEEDPGAGRPVVEKHNRRWWNFRQRTEVMEEDHVNKSLQSTSETKIEAPESETSRQPLTLLKTETPVTHAGDESPVNEEENEEDEDRDVTEETKQGLLQILAGFMENKRLKEVDARMRNANQNDDSWVEKFLDIIIPKRSPNASDGVKNAEPSSSATDSVASGTEEEGFRECVHVKGGEEERKNRNSANPLERLRGIRELYQPPPKISGHEKGKNSEDLARQGGKKSMVSKLIPWLGDSSTKDVIPEERVNETDTSNEPQLTENEVFPERRTTAKPSASKPVHLSNEPIPSTSSRLQKRRESEDSDDPVAVTPTLVSDEELQPGERSSDGNGQTKKDLVTTATSEATAVEVSSVPQKDVAAIRLIFGSETFFATETVSHPGGLIFRGNLRGEPKATLAKLEQRLAARLGDKYTLCLAEGEEDLRPVVVVVPTARDRRPASPRQKLIALAVGFITLTTCFARGAYANLHSGVIRTAYGLPSSPTLIESLFLRAPISCMAVSIAAIVLFSQFVQRIVAARRKTRIALPYLIPSYQLGSFGAVVQLASPTPTRAALFDIAFSGALTLLLVSLGLLVQGLRLSTSFSSVIPVSMSMVSSSMLIGALTTYVPQGQILVDYGKSWIGLHPLAVIGANCMTIAALNLLPIRQLDGGRIVSAIYGRKTAVLASRVTIFFLLLASAKVPYYFVFLAAVTFGPWSLDRPAKNELTEPNGVRAVLGYILLLTMVGILLPHPASKFFGTG